MARNEKKHCNRTVALRHCSQSTVEYVIVLPLLLALIFGIFELAFMWHQYNTMELVAREISANIVITNDMTCVDSDKALEVVQSRTAVLQEQPLSFTKSVSENELNFTSNQSYKGNPFVSVKIDCTPYLNNSVVQSAPSVQLEALHKLRFFSASLPNFRTGERIVIIPDNVVFRSTKVVSLSRY